MAVRTKPLMTAEDHRKLLRSLQCRAEKVKQAFEDEASLATPSLVCTTVQDNHRCFSFSQPKAAMWHIAAHYNDRAYELEVTEQSLVMYGVQGDQGSVEQFHFNSRDGLAFSSAGAKVAAAGLWLYFRTTLEGEDCKSTK